MKLTPSRDAKTRDAKTISSSPLSRLQDWYVSECNGDWEHSCGITIETLDNPGWLLSVDLTDTSLESASLAPTKSNISDSDWTRVEITEGRFKGTGGATNLEQLIELFFALVVDAHR
jgi:Immunity protein 53